MKRNERNKKYKNKIKNLTKRAMAFAQEENKNELKKIMPLIYKALDKAAKTGVLKKNTASRRKSKMARLEAKSSK